MSTSRNEDQKELEKLRFLLLGSEQESLADLQSLLNDPEQLEEKVGPIIESHLDTLKQNFPESYESHINRMIEQKLQGSKEEIISIIHPLLGKMIRKYIAHQFQMLREKIDSTVRSTFSRQGLKARVKAFFTGTKQSDIILNELGKYRIASVWIIEKNSGLLVARASKEEDEDEDVIAGMLTAIKAFAEDAFKKSDEDLELIEYGEYKIFLESFSSYYFAIGLTGAFTFQDRDAVTSQVHAFVEEKMTGKSASDLMNNQESLSEQLKEQLLSPKIVQYRDNVI